MNTLRHSRIVLFLHLCHVFSSRTEPVRTIFQIDDSPQSVAEMAVLSCHFCSEDVSTLLTHLRKRITVDSDTRDFHLDCLLEFAYRVVPGRSLTSYLLVAKGPEQLITEFAVKCAMEYLKYGYRKEDAGHFKALFRYLFLLLNRLEKKHLEWYIGMYDIRIFDIKAIIMIGRELGGPEMTAVEASLSAVSLKQELFSGASISVLLRMFAKAHENSKFETGALGAMKKYGSITPTILRRKLESLITHPEISLFSHNWYSGLCFASSHFFPADRTDVLTLFVVAMKANPAIVWEGGNIIRILLQMLLDGDNELFTNVLEEAALRNVVVDGSMLYDILPHLGIMFKQDKKLFYTTMEKFEYLHEDDLLTCIGIVEFYIQLFRTHHAKGKTIFGNYTPFSIVSTLQKSTKNSQEMLELEKQYCEWLQYFVESTGRRYDCGKGIK